MNQQAHRKGFVVGAVAIGVITGITVGFVTAHRTMGDMNQMDMKEQPMQDMPGMPAAPSGAVVIPAVMKQMIGVRSAPVGVEVLGQEIRAVGTVGYDERGFTQVTVKTSGWV